MGSKYLMKIRDIAEVFDGPHATPKKIDVGPYFLSISSLVNGQLDLSKSAHLSEEQFKKWTKRVTPQVGDVLFSYETRLGEAALMPAGVTACLGRRMGLLRPDQSKVLPEYLLYAYLSPVFQQEIKKRTIHGATVERISLRELPDFDIHIPEIKKQRKVINTLNAINNKISLNKKNNHTLEQMAQALFKSWFVDFDPVFDNLLASVDFKLENLESSLPEELKQKAQRRLVALNSLHNAAEIKASLSALAHELQTQLPTKKATQAAEQVSEKAPETTVKANFNANPNILAQHANTHAHFPSEFEHNEQLGWIPKGWEYGPFSKIAILKTESIHPKKSPDKLWSQFSLPAFDSGKTPSLDLGIEIKSGKYKLSNNVVLVSKLNPQTPRVWMPNVVDVESSVCSTEFMPFEPILEQHKAFIYALMSSKFIQTEIASRVTGTTGSHQRVSPKNIAVLDVILPSENCIKLYCEMVGPSFNKINLMSSQSTELTKLRDTLLPKLISGELQIPDIATDEEVVD